jgi:SAM-dependent methyltransferase
MSLKSWIKASPGVKRWALAASRAGAPLVQGLRPDALLRYAGFVSDYLRFRRAGGKAELLDFYPCLFDKSATTAIDPQYFHQAIWAFRHIRAGGAERHVDIGSEVNFVGLLTTITHVTFVDIRPLALSIPNFHGLSASIAALPFPSGSVRSLSCLHVIEHIGLGRYGDAIDPAGPEKACREIARVMAPGGRACISLPIGQPRVQFNGQRVFGAPEALALLAPLELKEFSMVDARGIFRENVDPLHADISEAGAGTDYGLGLFLLKAG